MRSGGVCLRLPRAFGKGIDPAIALAGERAGPFTGIGEAVRGVAAQRQLAGLTADAPALCPAFYTARLDDEEQAGGRRIGQLLTLGRWTNGIDRGNGELLHDASCSASLVRDTHGTRW